MEEKKKSNVGLIILVVILLLACIGMGTFILINKDKLIAKDDTTTTEKNSKNDTNSKNKQETIIDKKTGLTQEEIDKGCVICDSAGGKCCPVQ